MRVVITGGTGLIGRALAAELIKAKYEVVVLSRNPGKVKDLPEGARAVQWDGKTAQGWGELADGAYAIINLAGENLAGDSWFTIRLTKSRKERIVNSRVNAGTSGCGGGEGCQGETCRLFCKFREWDTMDRGITDRSANRRSPAAITFLLYAWIGRKPPVLSKGWVCEEWLSAWRWCFQRKAGRCPGRCCRSSCL